MRQFNRITFIALIGIVFAFLLYKAVKLPVVTDESITAVTFINYSVRDIVMYTDHYPNNHILNTLITKLLVSLFGNKQLVIRLPNLLFFILYGFGIFRINKAILKEDSVFFLPATLLFIANPYLLDFFGLCRGYGMSCALATLSVSYLLTAFKYLRARDIWIAWFLSVLASYAHFTLLIFWVATTLVAIFFFLLHSGKQIRKFIKPAVLLFLFTILYVALIAHPIINMHSSDEFRFWTSGGFYKDTVYQLIVLSRNGSRLLPGPHIIAVMIFMIIAVNIIFIFIRFKRSPAAISDLNYPVFVSTAVLLLTVAINLLQCWLLKTPNLQARTALFLYPLTVIVIVSFIGILPSFKYKLPSKLIAVAFAFICIFHLFDRFRLDWVRDAWHSADTFKVFDYLKQNQDEVPVTLKAHGFLFHSFYYYVFTGKVPWLKLEDYNEKFDINTNAEYYYIFKEDYKNLELKFEPVAEFGTDRILLKRKKEPSGVPQQTGHQNLK